MKEIVKERDSMFAAYKSSVNRPNANSLKDLFGYFNYVCLNQIQNVINDALAQLKNKLIIGFQKKSEESVQFHLVWGGLIASLTNILD